jgi:hypothetical protein
MKYIILCDKNGRELLGSSHTFRVDGRLNASSVHDVAQDCARKALRSDDIKTYRIHRGHLLRGLTSGAMPL